MMADYKTKLPISAQICTLNEENNIGPCIETILKNAPAEIIVIDGGSSDGTIKIAENMGAKVIRSEKGLARQRQAGIISTEQPYIALIDADDRLDPDCLSILLKEMNENGFDAIQANVGSFSNNTYWQTAWGIFCSININKAGKTNMVGRPSLFKREPIVRTGFDPLFIYGSEDTDFSYRFEKLGFTQGIGTGKAARIHPETFRECRGKWLNYGKGYARFAFKHPERRKSIIWHIAWNIPFKRMWNNLINGHFIYAPFYLLYGLFCVIGFAGESRRLSN